MLLHALTQTRIVIAETASEKEAIYRLRYEVYIDEMGGGRGMTKPMRRLDNCAMNWMTPPIISTPSKTSRLSPVRASTCGRMDRWNVNPS